MPPPAKRRRINAPSYAMRALSVQSRNRRFIGPRARPRKRMPIRVQGQHTFTRCCQRADADTKTITTLTGSAENLEFKFQQLESYNDFSTLFESYRITMITVTVQLITNPNATWNQNTFLGQSNGTNWFPKMWYAIDLDGGSADTLAEIKQRQGLKCRILKPDKVIKIQWTPKVRVQTYKTATTFGTAPCALTIDMADVEVPHYGLSYVIDTNGVDPNDNYPFKVIFETRYHFTCSGVR